MFTETFFMLGFLIALLLAVYFYFEAKNNKTEYERKNEVNKRKILELTILAEVSEKIGYSLSSKDIAATIASTAEKVFLLSSVSYALIENENVSLTTITHENVSPNYLYGVKQIVLQGLYAIDDSIKKFPVIETTSGVHIDSQAELLVDTSIQYDAFPKSYFNIPLVLNNRFTGIINITSKFPHAYQEEDMSMLYKIVNRAQLAIGRLENVIENEKGKVESLVKSLSSGAIFFTLENNALKLFTINRAAKRYLKLSSDNVDLIQILSSFNLTPNIITEMKDVIIKRKSTFYRDVYINNLRLNIYLTPVFSLETEKIIGVALTMQDVTRENEIEKLREGFTNIMVHELRAPLTAIKGAASLLVANNLDEDDEVKMKLIIKNSSERLLEDINEILDSAKIDSGKLLIEKKKSDINSIIRKSSENLSYVSKSASISIENHLDDTIPLFAFDSLRIEEVMNNLISNAIKFSKEGGLIEIFSRVRGNEVEIEVSDHGIGIESSKINSLFRPFSQAGFANSTKGTGLGLYISKAIVEAHGGVIRLESRQGEGTQVFVTLPISLEEAISPVKTSMVN